MGNSLFKNIVFSKPMIILELGIVLFFGFHVGKEILQKRAIEAQIQSLEAEIGKLENNKDELGSLLEYIKTDAFVERQAREKLNLVKAGESVVVIPDVDADAPIHGIVLGESQPEAGQPLADNIKLWWEYFFDHDHLWLD